uniref:Uncharacterized protein n=1 Tax=Anguilla anguilla TaxID=7936 RepID=A0A0E9VWD3_ANGAN
MMTTKDPCSSAKVVQYSCLLQRIQLHLQLIIMAS